MPKSSETQLLRSKSYVCLNEISLTLTFQYFGVYDLT